jgi:predicted nucleic acid-binding protein
MQEVLSVMRVLIDTNVILDFLQEREPFVENAARLFERTDAGEIQGFITSTTITNISGQDAQN